MTDKSFMMSQYWLVLSFSRLWSAFPQTNSYNNSNKCLEGINKAIISLYYLLMELYLENQLFFSPHSFVSLFLVLQCKKNQS